MSRNATGDDADAAGTDATGDPDGTRADGGVEARSPYGLAGPAPDERPTPAGRRNEQGIRVDPDVEAEPPIRRVIISALVDHEPGVLARISGLFSRRQFNIESLTVGPTEDGDVARMTIVVEEPEPGIEQVKKQLAKQLPVISVTELDGDAIDRELALIKVADGSADEVDAVARVFGGTAVDVGAGSVTVEVTGEEGTIDRAVDAFERFGVEELVRTGTAAIARGDRRTAELGGPGEATDGDA